MGAPSMFVFSLISVGLLALLTTGIVLLAVGAAKKRPALWIPGIILTAIALGVIVLIFTVAAIFLHWKF